MPESFIKRSGCDAHFIHGVDYALGNGVVSAASAERGLAAAVVQYLQSQTIRLGARSRGRIAYDCCH